MAKRRRHIALPAHGQVLVSTDVHGDGHAFRALEARWRSARASVPQTHWVILGDIVHGPSPEFRRRQPELYDYQDESAWIGERVIALQDEAPDLVHFVLGNHDYAHIGGPRTRKFYQDEAETLEAQLRPPARERLRALFERAALAVSTPCGVLMTHGAPNEALRDLSVLEELESFPPTAPLLEEILDGVLFAYGQSGDVIDAVCAACSAAPGYPHDRPLRVVVHGHDRDEEGWFTEAHNQFVPVIFGAPRQNQRHLMLDLTAYYRDVSDIRDGLELQRLFPTE